MGGYTSYSARSVSAVGSRRAFNAGMAVRATARSVAAITATINELHGDTASTTTWARLAIALQVWRPTARPTGTPTMMETPSRVTDWKATVAALARGVAPRARRAANSPARRRTVTDSACPRPTRASRPTNRAR